MPKAKATTDEKEILKRIKELHQKEDARKEAAKKTLKIIGEKLFLDLVNTVEAHYNGEGDSGDIEELVFKDVDDKELDYEINDEIENELINALFYFLPGGWEINEGSYGVVYFDVRNKELKISHEERVMDTNHQEYKYPL